MPNNTIAEIQNPEIPMVNIQGDAMVAGRSGLAADRSVAVGLTIDGRNQTQKSLANHAPDPTALAVTAAADAPAAPACRRGSS